MLLATGGFQGDTELRKRFLGWDADRILVRSNRGSTGDGFRMAASAGAAASHGLGTFYGHTVASPLSAFEPGSYLPLAQYHSKWCILVNQQGRRYMPTSIPRRRHGVTGPRDHVLRQTRLSLLVRMNAKQSRLRLALRSHRPRSPTTCASLANPNGPATLRVHDRQFVRLLSEMSPRRRALNRLEKYRCAVVWVGRCHDSSQIE